MLPPNVWKPVPVLLLGALVFLGLLAGMAAMLAFGESLEKWWNVDKLFVQHVISFTFVHGLALVWVTLFLRAHQVSWIQAFGFGRAPVFSVAMAIATFIIVIPLVVVGIGGIVLLILKLFGVSPAAQETITAIKEQSSPLKLAVLGFAATVLAPLVEEVLFRGVLYPAIKHQGYPRSALWGTALLFGLVHFNFAAFIPLTFLALVFTWLYERTGNLLASIAGHCVFNAFNFWMLVSPPEALKDVIQQ